MPTDRFDPRARAASFLDEFRGFAFKGNVIDLAIGVIIGGAFGNLTKSLVDNLIMPLVAAVLPGEGGYRAWSFTLNGQAVPYGQFLADVVNFLLVALVLFVFLVKFVGWLARWRREAPPEAQPVLTKDQQLLTEIRDLLGKDRPA